jgi:FKBP-type peptidyl-prolyl cis-trans isomerase 2
MRLPGASTGDLLLRFRHAQEENYMPPQQGEKVRVHYTGTLDSGEVFDSSRDRDPLEFTVGGGQIIPGFENAVKEMEVGETRTVTLPPEDAYGPADPNLIQDVDRSLFPEDAEITPGQQFQAQQPDGNTVLLRVVEATDESVKVDANHPLAGQSLTFELELTEVVA